MSTREQIVGMLDDLSEEQLKAVAVILSGMSVHSKGKNAAEVKGILHRFANPDLIPAEEGAWERDIAERAANGDESF